jgi:hypothetical protein
MPQHPKTCIHMPPGRLVPHTDIAIACNDVIVCLWCSHALICRSSGMVMSCSSSSSMAPKSYSFVSARDTSTEGSIASTTTCAEQLIIE